MLKRSGVEDWRMWQLVQSTCGFFYNDVELNIWFFLFASARVATIQGCGRFGMLGDPDEAVSSRSLSDRTVQDSMGVYYRPDYPIPTIKRYPGSGAAW